MAFSQLSFLTLVILFRLAVAEATVQANLQPINPEKLQPIKIHQLPQSQPIVTHINPSNNRLATKESYVKKPVVRVTIKDTTGSYTKFDNLIGIMDRVAYVVSKPATIISTLKFITLAISSMLMSTIDLSSEMLDKRREHKRERGFGLFLRLTGQDLESVIESTTSSYDKTLDKAGFGERSSCRERSVCTLGDMMACDYPGLVVISTRLAMNHLPPIDIHKHKYIKALALGLNRTDCDYAYRTSSYECPTFQDYVRSYFFSGRRRRDYFSWRGGH